MADSQINLDVLVAVQKAQSDLASISQSIRQVDRDAKNAGKGGADIGKEFLVADRALRQMLRTGSGLLGLFGVGGGLAGGVAAIVAEAERLHQVLLRSGEQQAKIGRTLSGVAGAGGAAVVASVSKLARELGIPEEKVAAKYTAIKRDTYATGAGLESQVRAALVDEMGGPGYAERRKAAEKVAPQIRFAGIMDRVKGQGEEWLTRPETPSAARNIAQAQAVSMYEQALDMVAQKYHGVGKWKDTSWLVNEGTEVRRIAEMVNVMRSQQGLSPIDVPTANDTAASMQWGIRQREGGGQAVLSSAEVRELAQQLLDAAGELKKASTDQSAAQRTPR